jgi:protein-S-isoprenylcysteine O-methyltransferase Ste14
MSSISLSKNWSYERTMQLSGSIWFLLLALLVAMRIGTFTDPWPTLLPRFCLAIFYMLLAVLIMTRPPARAQADGLLPRVAAFVGTYMPWTISLFGTTDDALLNALSTVFVLTGMVMMLVTIRHLGRSFSLVPQARSVVQTGPYRWIKHPLYLFEEIVVLGVVLQHLSTLAVIVLALHIGVQIYRILYEEDLLRRTYPEYTIYERSRWRLIPYIW